MNYLVWNKISLLGLFISPINHIYMSCLQHAVNSCANFYLCENQGWGSRLGLLVLFFLDLDLQFINTNFLRGDKNIILKETTKQKEKRKKKGGKVIRKKKGKLQEEGVFIFLNYNEFSLRPQLSLRYKKELDYSGCHPHYQCEKF